MHFCSLFLFNPNLIPTKPYLSLYQLEFRDGQFFTFSFTSSLILSLLSQSNFFRFSLLHSSSASSSQSSIFFLFPANLDPYSAFSLHPALLFKFLLLHLHIPQISLHTLHSLFSFFPFHRSSYFFTIFSSLPFLVTSQKAAEAG